MQVPGVDYTKKFSPVTKEATTKLIIAFTLSRQNKEQKCYVIDIEVAFLEGQINIPMLIKWLPGMVSLGYITEQMKKLQCIRLKGIIYGNINAALRVYHLYAQYFIKMGFIRSCADPCLLIFRNEQLEVIMLASCHIDDTQIAGEKAELEKFKQELCERFNIKDLGVMKKH